MSTAKVAITLDENLLKRLERLVKNWMFENRNRAIQEAVSEKLARSERSGLARECAKLDKKFEQPMAEEGLLVEVGGMFRRDHASDPAKSGRFPLNGWGKK
jgi:Arc/MetJ-type ribon-helix-helix transcriptional regulator